MEPLSQHIGLIGGGNMGEAMIGAVIRAELAPASNITVSDVRPERLQELAAAYGVNTITDNSDLFARSDILIIAVKPQDVPPLLTSITVSNDIVDTRKIIISIAAGVRLSTYEDLLYAPLSAEARTRLPIIRVMPNTPALVLTGMSGMSPNGHATEADIDTARRILAVMGKVIAFDEPDLDAVTAVSGSGPAYVFYLAEAMMEAGRLLGLTPDNARDLTIGTIAGAVALMEHSGEPPETLRKRVTSPGGTTQAAVTVLEDRQVRQSVVDAIAAAAARSRELSG